MAFRLENEVFWLGQSKTTPIRPKLDLVEIRLTTQLTTHHLQPTTILNSESFLLLVVDC